METYGGGGLRGGPALTGCKGEGEEKSDLFTVPYIKHSLTAVQKKDEGNNVFFMHLNRWTQSQVSFLISFWLWLLDYQVGTFVFILRLCQHLPWTPWSKNSFSAKKGFAVYFPAAFSCEILRQLGHVRAACEGRDCNWSRLPQMKHGCLKRQWHTFSLTCSVRASLLVWFLTVSHEPICTGLTKVALSAGRQSNRSSVCGEHQRRISTGVSQCQRRFARSNLWEIWRFFHLKNVKIYSLSN